jgi:hypothetical protein
MRHHHLFLVVLFSVGSLHAQPTAATRGWHTATVTVTPERFDEAEIVRRSRLVLRNDCGLFCNVWFFATEQDSARFRNAKHSIHTSYQSWRQAYDSIRNVRFPMAELVVFGTDAVVRYRDADGRIARHVLAGSDPSTVRLKDRTFQLLYFALSAVPNSLSDRVLQVFASSPDVADEESALSLLSHLAGRLKFRRVLLQVRSDPWFINAPAYPLFPAFEVGASPPSYEEYKTSMVVSCSTRATGPPFCTTISTQ